MEKRLIQFICVALAIWLVWALWRPFWKYDLNEAEDYGSTKKVIFEVEKGASAKTIAENLEEQGLIVSDVSFVRTVESEGLDGLLRYGRFVLSPGMTLREIITILTTTGTGELAVTVVEGWTIKDIDAELTALELTSEGAFRSCTINCTFAYDFLEGDGGLEGFLFPDTYFLDSSSFSSEDFIKMMLNNFDEKWTDQMQTDLEASDRTLRQVVTVASMLEKEVRTAYDIPFVAEIIWKRLDAEWMLGIDATLLYTDSDGELSYEDLTADNPYNTRVNKGLPPTAIGNPGLTSLEGALYPEHSYYWFYLTDPENGGVIYAVTDEEHEANKAKYLQ